MFISMLRYVLLRPYYLALFISALLALWMLSSPAKSERSKVESNVDTALAMASLPQVTTTYFVPQEIIKTLHVYGKSEASRAVVIRAEIEGKIIKVSSKKGQTVDSHKKLANIEQREVPAQLVQAKAQLLESELNYKAVKSLNDKGLQGRVRLAEVKSLHLVAKTQVKKLQLQLARTQVVAPFSGILQQQFVEQGDHVKVGDPLFNIENINPIVIRADVTEHHINQLTLGQKVSAKLLSGDVIVGKMTFIASQADNASSTFTIEAEFPNPNLNIFSGVSAELTIPLYPVDAIYVSPSALALDEMGNLGVKLVQQNVVIFNAIKIVETDVNGVWLSGFNGPVDIITLGQGFVKAGSKVHAVTGEAL